MFQGSGEVRDERDVTGEIKAPKPSVRLPAPPRIDIADLLKGGREAVLVHDGTEYRLSLTSNGKLILTK